MYTNELYHHGIKGQKWGLRRFQNSDGSYTDAGKRRRADSDRDWAAKNSSQLSDDDLNKRISRLQKEKQLKDLTDQVVHPGRKMARDLLDRYGNQAVATAVGAAASAAATVYITKKINPPKSTYEQMFERESADRILARKGYYSKHYDERGNVKPKSSGGGKKHS